MKELRDWGGAEGKELHDRQRFRRCRLISDIMLAWELTEDWARPAMTLGVKCLHVAERDNHVSSRPESPGVFVNTWSVDGLLSEGFQPAGTHEINCTAGGHRHDRGPGHGVWIGRPGGGMPGSVRGCQACDRSSVCSSPITRVCRSRTTTPCGRRRRVLHPLTPAVAVASCTVPRTLRLTSLQRLHPVALRDERIRRSTG